jgi:hypothetical protein
MQFRNTSALETENFHLLSYQISKIHGLGVESMTPFVYLGLEAVERCFFRSWMDIASCVLRHCPITDDHES